LIKRTRKYITRKAAERKQNRKGRGHVGFVFCDSGGGAVPKDKAISRMVVRNMVDAATARDLKEASVYENFMVPKVYRKMHYAVSTAVHSRIIHGRSRVERRNRLPPPRFNAGPPPKKET